MMTRAAALYMDLGAAWKQGLLSVEVWVILRKRCCFGGVGGTRMPGVE